jgi:putative ABC transport system permease protein
MHPLRQLWAATLLTLQGLPERLWTSLVIVVGTACVVGVLLSMLSYSTGLQRNIASAGDPSRAIVVTKGAADEFNQLVKRDMAATILQAPGIAKDADGKPIGSTEHLTNVPVKRKSDGLRVATVLRGVSEKGFVLRPEFKLVSGRMFQAGHNELIAGAAAASQFQGLNLGDKVNIRASQWTVVGIFTTGGDMLENQLLAEVETKLAAVQRNGFGSVIVRLESPNAFDRFKAGVLSNPTLNVDVERQSDFYARNAGRFTGFLSTLAFVLGGIMGLGALFGIVNVMYTIVGARTREIATLRALGFGAAPVAFSVVAEALLLAAFGGAIGAATAWLLFNGNRNALGGNLFDLAVTPGLIALGLSWALATALLGSLFPAIRAARLPVATALRSG